VTAFRPIIEAARSWSDDNSFRLHSGSCLRALRLPVSSDCSKLRKSAFCQLERLRSAAVLHCDDEDDDTYKQCAIKQQFALPAESALSTERFKL